MRDVEGRTDCQALGQILDLIADKWTIMTVASLSNGPRRFNGIMRDIGGVSHRMLTLTLRGLAAHGLVTRTAYAVIPPKVEYELTALGRSLLNPLTVLAGWAVENRPLMEQSRLDFEKSVITRGSQATVTPVSTPR